MDKIDKYSKGRIIVALSGGKASAWCAGWALRTFEKERVVLYFNDTKWENEDLYRFLDDLSKYFDHEILVDADGRSPADLFFTEKALASSRMPFCSRILKAERLQAFYKDGDSLVFGIGPDEYNRARRIIAVYQKVSAKEEKYCKILLPLIIENVSSEEVDGYLEKIGVEEPLLYRKGFEHNNCGGGCVRAGKKQWKKLYEEFPEVYAERERVEEEFREHFKKDVSIMRDETLKAFRGRIERGELSQHYSKPDRKKPKQVECVGVCDTFN